MGLFGRKPTCPHCGADYSYVKHIRERITPAIKNKEAILLSEIDKLCKHCETRWVHSYDSTFYNCSWEQCKKDCDCGFVETHKKGCASEELT